MRHGAKRSAPAVVLAGCGLALCAGLALAGEPLQPEKRSSPSEAGLMILVTTGILLAGVLLTRALVNRKVFKSHALLLPILVALSGAAWVEMSVAKHQGVDNLYALVRFLFLFLLYVSLLYLVAKLAIPSEAQRTRAGLPPLIRTFAVLFLAFVGLFALLMWSFPQLSLTPLFVTSGLVSIVIGLAVQDLLSNLLAGIVLSVERPFKVGDWVKIGESEGEVTEINWRTTKILNRQADHMDIPNSLIAKERVMNFDQPTAQHLLKIHVGVSYDTPPGITVKALLEAASRAAGVLKNPAADVYFKEFEDSSLLYELRAWIENYESAPAIESDVRKEIWYAFKRHGVTIPFPQRDVNFRRVAESPMQERARLVAAAGLQQGVLYELGEEAFTIGRDEQNRLCINDHRVSNEHAVIELQAGNFVLRDLGSRLGTLVNGRPITSVVLRPGDEIGVGHVQLVFESSLVAKL